MFELLAWGESGWGDEFARGALVTITLAVASFAVSLVFGVVFAVCKLSRHSILRITGDVYTTVFRGIPELLVLYLVFFGGGLLLSRLAALLFGYGGRIDIPVFAAGALCIGLSNGAYATEAIRAAVLAVPRGQIDAARAIGLRRVQRVRFILLPQALRFALPGLGNVWMIVLKDTSLVSIVGLAEIIRTAQLGAGAMREPFSFYIVAFLIFLALGLASQRLLSQTERWADRGVTRRSRGY